VKFADRSKFPVLVDGGGDLSAVIAENIGDDGLNAFDLDRIKMPSGGGVFWQIPGLDGPTSEKTFEAVVVLWEAPRAYWEKGLDDKDAEQGPPDCSSENGKLGNGKYGVGSTENPTGECSGCPMNQWGSEPKAHRGKACNETRLLFVLRPGAILPIAVSLPPTSLKAMKQYMLRLAGAGISYYAIITKFSLIESVNKSNQKFSVLEPAPGERLDEPTTAAAKGYGAMLKESLRQMPMSAFVEQPPADDPFAEPAPAEPAAAGKASKPPAE